MENLVPLDNLYKTLEYLGILHLLALSPKIWVQFSSGRPCDELIPVLDKGRQFSPSEVCTWVG